MPSAAKENTTAEGAMEEVTKRSAETAPMSVDVHQFESYEVRAADRQSLEDLGHQIVELAGHLNAANYRFLMLIAEWDRRKGWGGEAACEQIPVGSVSAETPNVKWRIDPSARKVDALAMVAETFLAQGTGRAQRWGSPSDRSARRRRDAVSSIRNTASNARVMSSTA